MDEHDCFRWPRISEETIARVAQLLRAGRTSINHELVERFEAELCRFFQVEHALLTCNGTSAGFSCFHALGLGPGSELIAPPFTHSATVLPATRLGCRVVFADLEPDSLGLSIEAVERCLTPATRAVVACHLYGNPTKVRELRELCNRRGLFLIEDISHAPGAIVDGRPVGSFGDMAFLSMQSAKLISGGEGGALLTHDAELYARALELGHPKRISRAKGLPPGRRLSAVGLGYKFRISALHALLGYESFKTLPETNALRRDMLSIVRESLGEVPRLRWPREDSGTSRVYWEYEMFIEADAPRPADVARRLQERGFIADVTKFEFLPDLPHFEKEEHRGDAWPNARRRRGDLLVLPAFTAHAPEVATRLGRTLREVVATGESRARVS